MIVEGANVKEQRALALLPDEMRPLEFSYNWLWDLVPMSPDTTADERAKKIVGLGNKALNELVLFLKAYDGKSWLETSFSR